MPYLEGCRCPWRSARPGTCVWKAWAPAILCSLGLARATWTASVWTSETESSVTQGSAEVPEAKLHPPLCPYNTVHPPSDTHQQMGGRGKKISVYNSSEDIKMYSQTFNYSFYYRRIHIHKKTLAVNCTEIFLFRVNGP